MLAQRARAVLRSCACFRALALALLVSALGCERKEATTTGKSEAVRATRAALPREPKLARPVELLALKESAYGPLLEFDGESVVLLTLDAAHWITPGQQPERVPLSLGPHRALGASSIFYWSDGAFFAVPKRGGAKARLGAAAEPSLLRAGGQRLVWIVSAELGLAGTGLSRVATLAEGRPVSLYETKAPLKTLHVLGDWAFFVEQSTSLEWRIGAVSLDASAGAQREPTFTRARRGRAPAMLVGRTELYFYESGERSVHRLSPDFVIDEVIAERVVCSPLAVAERVVCAQVSGIYEIARAEPNVRPLSTQPLGLVTALAVDSRRAAWVNDSGSGLVVRALELPQAQ